VALLRAINLGARNKVPMAALRDVCRSVGADNVRTYIASGNVVFDSPLAAAPLRDQLEGALQREFGFYVPVRLLTQRELELVVLRNPFAASSSIDEARGTVHHRGQPSRSRNRRSCR
jgi:uncharacterized protein (DUF1697 family)